MSQPAPGFKQHPGHTLSFEPCSARAVFSGTPVAESAEAIQLREGSYAPIVYFPPEALAQKHFAKTSHSTYCPFKGKASYWSLETGGARSENAAWAYEDPYDECLGIQGYVAFYPDRVQIEVL